MFSGIRVDFWWVCVAEGYHCCVASQQTYRLCSVTHRNVKPNVHARPDPEYSGFDQGFLTFRGCMNFNIALPWKNKQIHTTILFLNKQRENINTCVLCNSEAMVRQCFAFCMLSMCSPQEDTQQCLSEHEPWGNCSFCPVMPISPKVITNHLIPRRDFIWVSCKNAHTWHEKFLMG